MTTQDDLRALITPELLKLIAEAQLPFSKTEPLDFADVTDSMFSSGFGDKLRPTAAREALILISHMSPNGEMPSPSDLDLMSFLPPPESPDFPQQCLGLQLLVEQGSRVLFDGVDHRWQLGLFGPLARRFAGQWLALPAAQRPDSWARCRDDMGVESFDYWIVSRITWLAPMIHDEDIDSQKIVIAIIEETRAMFEERFGLTDPYLATREQLLKDDLVFLREMSNLGPPRDDDGKIDRATWVFWWCMILDAHFPIIDHFGRYPYRNAILGRESTAAENRWLDDTSHIAEAAADVAAKIKSDVANGVWTPLGQSG